MTYEEALSFFGTGRRIAGEWKLFWKDLDQWQWRVPAFLSIWQPFLSVLPPWAKADTDVVRMMPLMIRAAIFFIVAFLSFWF